MLSEQLDPCNPRRGFAQSIGMKLQRAEQDGYAERIRKYSPAGEITGVANERDQVPALRHSFHHR
jgi:hypothetical protein